MKKVLEVMGEGISHGGEEAFIANLINNIDMTGLSIDWLTPYKCNNSFYAECLEKKGGNVYEMGLTYTPGKNRWHLIRPFNKYFKEHKYDVVHIHSGSISALSLIAYTAYTNDVKSIILHSHSEGGYSIKSKLIKKVFSPIMKRCSTNFLACSMEAAITKFPISIVNNDKVIIVNNGINLENYKPNLEVRNKIRNELRIPDESRVIGHVGRFSPEKNHRLILETFKEVLKTNKDVVLLLVGDGSLYEEIVHLSKELSLFDKVRFTGYVNNVHEYYKAMDLFVFPSIFEGFGIAALEAQATGLPCIIADCINKRIKVNPNVYSLPIGNNMSQEWASCICEHINDHPIDNQEHLRKIGYDIKDTAYQIRKIYFEG